MQSKNTSTSKQFIITVLLASIVSGILCLILMMQSAKLIDSKIKTIERLDRIEKALNSTKTEAEYYGIQIEWEKTEE